MGTYTAKQWCTVVIAIWIDWIIDKVNSIAHVAMQDFMVITLERAVINRETSVPQYYNNMVSNYSRAISNIAHANVLFYPLYYDISLTSLKITQVFHLLLDFAENQIVFWDFKIQKAFR